jgi:choline-phosphate cytidylyltransferase/glycerol-3-phosphate cytidylyltransferase
MIKGYSFHAGDLFHVGHLHQLKESRKHCDFLIVGLLTDHAVASYKRPPIIPYPYREAIYNALEMVDKVVPQDSRDPTDNLKNLQPDVLFHGSDWEEVPGREWMEQNGKKVVITPYFYGMSTSEIIRRCRESQDEK